MKDHPIVTKANTLQQAILSTVFEPAGWNEVCHRLAKHLQADWVTLEPEKLSRHAKRFGQFNQPIAPVQQPQDRYFAQSFDFGIDGTWVLKLCRAEYSKPFSEIEMIEVLKCLDMVASTAAASRKVLDQSLKSKMLIYIGLGIPFAVLDGRGRLVGSSSDFDKICSNHFDVRSGLLTARAPESEKACRRALAMVSDGSAEVEVLLQHDIDPCVAVFSKLPESSNRISSEALVGLALRHSLMQGALPEAILVKMFGLTNREANIAARLVAGRGVNQIAIDSGVSVGTIRVQLKSIFKKLSVSSQIELVSKLQGKNTMGR